MLFVTLQQRLRFPSVEQGWYFENNAAGTLNLLNAMTAAKCYQLVFSSTAAVYGDPSSSRPITENFEAKPINPYGESKSIAERHIHQWASKPGHCATIYRYLTQQGLCRNMDWGSFINQRLI